MGSSGLSYMLPAMLEVCEQCLLVSRWSSDGRREMKNGLKANAAHGDEVIDKR